MKKEEMTEFALKVVAVSYFVRGVATIAATLTALISGLGAVSLGDEKASAMVREQFSVVATTGLLYVAASIILILNATTIVNKCFRFRVETESDFKVISKDGLSLSFRLIGVYFLMGAACRFIANGIPYVFPPKESPILQGNRAAQLLDPMFGAIAAASLFLAAQKLAEFLWRRERAIEADGQGEK